MTSFPYSLYMESCHQTLHEMEQDFDDTVFLALTERDIIALALALATLTILYPCLGERSLDLQVRLKELLYAQRPEWMVDDGSSEE